MVMKFILVYFWNSFINIYFIYIYDVLFISVYLTSLLLVHAMEEVCLALF